MQQRVRVRARLSDVYQVPPNGLILYTGTIMTEEGKEKKVNIDFEPFKPINTSLYLCDNKFHTEARAEAATSAALTDRAARRAPLTQNRQALSELLESENKYGFIVMDGNGSLFGTLSGNTREARAAAAAPTRCG